MSESNFPGRSGMHISPFTHDNTSGGNEQTSPGSISRVMEEDEDAVVSPTTASYSFAKGGPSAFGGAFGGDASGEGPPSSFKPTGGDGFPAHYGMGRRTSVSAESLNPTASSNDSWTPPFHPKSQDQLARLKKSISGNFLFNHLDDEQNSQVLGALVEKPIPAKGIKVCVPFYLHSQALAYRLESLALMACVEVNNIPNNLSGRSSYKATRVISSMWSRKALLMSTSILRDPCSQAEMVLVVR